LKSGERVMRSAPSQISQGRIDGCLPEENDSITATVLVEIRPSETSYLTTDDDE